MKWIFGGWIDIHSVRTFHVIKWEKNNERSNYDLYCRAFKEKKVLAVKVNCIYVRNLNENVMTEGMLKRGVQ